jgi:hypothetical protein
VYKEADYIAHHKAEEVEFGFKYNSGTNSEWVSIEGLRQLIVDHVDHEFTV